MKTKKLLSFVAAATMTITALAGSLSASVIGASAVDVQVTADRGSWKMTSITNASELTLNQNNPNCKISGLDGKNDIKVTVDVTGITETSYAYIFLSAVGGGESYSVWKSSDKDANTYGITNPYTEIPSDGRYTMTLHRETPFADGTNFNVFGVYFKKNTTSDAVREVNATLVSVSTDNGLSVIASGKCGENATFELYSDGNMKISGTGAVKLSDVDTKVLDYSAKLKIKKIEIEEGITELAEDCFKGFTGSFNKVALPSTLTTIGKKAFYDCRVLEEIDIPDSVTSIGEMAFNMNNTVLTTIKVPAGVTEITDNQFASCYQLRKIIIGENVTSIGKMAFNSASRTKDVYIYSKNLETIEPYKTAVEQEELGNAGYYVNVMSAFDKTNKPVFHVYKGSKTEQTLRDAKYIEKDSDVSYIDEETPVTPPVVTPAETVDSGKCGDNVKWTLDANGVLTLSGKGNMTEETKLDAWLVKAPEWEFTDHKADITKVVVGKDVTSIGRGAFKGSAVAEIEFEAKVLDSHFKIGREAFADCANLTKFDLSDKLMGISFEQFIGYAAFQNCTSLQTVILPDGGATIKIGARAFMGCTALKNVLFPQAVEFDYNLLKDCVISAPGDSNIVHNPTAIGGQFAGCTALEGVYFFNPYEYVWWKGDENKSIFFKDGEEEKYGEEKWAQVYLYADIFDADTNAEFYFNKTVAGSESKCYALNELRRTTNIEKIKAKDYLTNGDHDLAQSVAFSSLETWIDFAEIVEGKKGFIDDQGKLTVENIYTDETYAAFKTALDTAKGVDTTPGARDFSNILTTIPDSYTYTKSMKAVVPLAKDIDAITTALKDSMDALKGKPCNYDRVDAALAQVPKDLSIYTDDTVTPLRNLVIEVNRPVNRNLTMENGHQQDVFNWAAAILKNIENLEYKPADFTAVDEAISKVPEDLTIYTDETVKVLNDALEAVDRTKNITEQEIVDAYVQPIIDAIEALVLKPADYTAVDKAIAKVPTDLSKYTDATVKALKAAINAVDRTKNITEQAVVDGYAKAINDAISALKVKPAPTTKTTAKPTRNAKQVAKDKKAAKKAMKQAKITKLTVKSKAKKKINVSWKKVKKAKGYQVQVSAKKNFKKVIFNKDLKKTKLTIKSKKIKSKKTYCVRVRAYATYKNKNNKTVKVYSKWNKKLRKVTVK